MTEEVAGGVSTGSLDGDLPATPAGPPAVGAQLSRRPLGRDQILREAVRLIDAEGRERLTMRLPLRSYHLRSARSEPYQD